MGAGAYTALVLAAQDVSCRLIDRVGSDVYGEMTVEEVSAAGLDVTGIVRFDGAHMFCLSIVDETGEGGTMVINYPAPWQRTIDSFRAEIDEAPLASIVYFYSWYWSFAHPALLGASTRELVFRAAKRGSRVLLDPNYKPAPPPPHENLVELRAVLSSLDVLLPNARDAALIVGERDPVSTVRALQSLGAHRVVLKCGPAGAYAADGVGPVVHIPAPEVRVRDTTGAGDCFGGGFAAAWHRQETLVRATAEGIAAATFAISEPAGTRYRPLADVQALADRLMERSAAA